MYKLTPYISKIEKYYNSLINNYELRLVVSDDNHIQLVGRKYKLIITIERYYPDLRFAFKDNFSSKEVTVFSILGKKTDENQPLLSENQMLIADGIKDEVEKELYGYSLIIEKYCKEVLEGKYF